MIAMIRSEVYRFFHQKGTWILLLILFLILSFTSVCTGVVFGNKPFVKDFYQQIMNLVYKVGEPTLITEYSSIATIRETAEGWSRFQYLSASMISLFPIFMMAVVLYFTEYPRNNGFVQHQLSNTSRNGVLICESILLLGISFFLVTLEALVSFLVQFIFFETADYSGVGSYGLLFLIRVLALWSFGEFCVFICRLFKKNFIGFLFLLFCIFAGFDFIHLLLDMVLQGIFGKNINSMLFTPYGIASGFPVEYSLKQYLVSVGCLVVFLIGFFVYKFTVYKKKDWICNL